MEGLVPVQGRGCLEGPHVYAEGESFYVCSGELAWGPKYMTDADAVETCSGMPRIRKQVKPRKISRTSRQRPAGAHAAPRHLGHKTRQSELLDRDPETTQRIEPRKQQRLRAVPK